MLVVLVQSVGGESLAAVPTLDTGPVERSPVGGHEGLGRVDRGPAGWTLRRPSHHTQSGAELRGAYS